MVQINFAQKQVNAKIVYYGPGMSGKTTNLEIIHQRAPKANRGELTSISTDGDRTLFFDFMPLDLGTVAGMRTCFQIYTVPGQVYYNSTRKLVLQGVDGVIFVADSSASMMEENLESLKNLETNLAEYGRNIDEIAVVIQYNKRDLPDALSVEDLEAQMNPHGFPCFEGVAHTGQGVFPTLKALAARVIENIHNQQRAAFSPSSGGGSRRPTRAETAPESPAAAAAPAPPAPLPAAASQSAVPATVAAGAQAPPVESAPAAPKASGGLRLSEPAQSRGTAEAEAPALAARPRRKPEAPAPRQRRREQPEPSAGGGRRKGGARQQGQSAKGARSGKQTGKQAGKQTGNGSPAGRRQKVSNANTGSRRSPRPTPVQKKSNRSTVLTAVIVIASVGIGAVLGSLVLGAL